MTDDKNHVTLMKKLRSDDANDRLDAVNVLGKHGDWRAVDALIPLLQDPSSDVRRDTVLALRRIGDTRAFSAMCQMLGDPETAVRRRTSAWIMSMGQDSRLVPALIDVLTHTEQRIPAREFAAMALGNIADHDAVEPLAETLLVAPPELKRRITHSLSLMPDVRAIPALAMMLHDDDIPTTKIAAKTLRKIATDEAHNALKDAGLPVQP